MLDRCLVEALAPGDFLPPAAERAQLAEQLGELVARRGVGPLVNALLVQPNADFFPDRWAGGEASVRRVLLRLLRYAGLAELDVEVVLLDEDPDKRAGAPAPRGSFGLQTQLWLTGITAGRCRVAIEATLLRDPSSFVAAAARAVAHAYRRHHGLERIGDPLEEARIDVTTVYLGFGIVTTDATLRHATTPSGGFRSARSVLQLGVLAPQAMAYLLALQAVARGLGRGERREIASMLQVNPSTFFKAALRAVDGEPQAMASLRLPPRSEWPTPADAASLLAPLPAAVSDETIEEPRRDVDAGVRGGNLGKPVFRVERSMAGRMARFLGMATFVLGGLVTRSYVANDVDPAMITTAAIVLAAIGLLVGLFLRDSRCSDPKCGAKLDRTANTCPWCGGEIVGVIRHPRERLAAEEDHRRGSGRDPSESGKSGAPEGDDAIDEEQRGTGADRVGEDHARALDERPVQPARDPREQREQPHDHRDEGELSDLHADVERQERADDPRAR